MASRAVPLVRTGGGIALAVLCTVLAVHDVDLASVPAHWSQVQPLPLALAAGMVLVSILAKAGRWQVLCAPHARPPLVTLTAGILVGQTVNNLVPVRLGEIVRVYLVGERLRLSRSLLLGTVLVEKALDALTLALLLTVLLPLVALPTWLPWPRVGTTILGAGLIGLVLASLPRIGVWLERWPWVHRWDLARRGREMASALRALGAPRRAALAGGWSLVAIGAGLLTNYGLLLALDLPASLLAAAVLLIVLYVGGTVPATVGRLGVFHYLVVLTLGGFGLPKATALSYAVLLHGLVIVLPTVAGLLCAWYWGVRPGLAIRPPAPRPATDPLERSRP